MKKIIIFIVSIVAILGIFFLIGSSVESNLGGMGGTEGDYVRVTSGTNQVVSPTRAILHKVIIGAATDEVVIADHASSFLSNEVMHLDPSAAGVFILDTVFLNGITTSVTATDGMIFVISPY